MPINQFTAEIGRNVQFSLTALTCHLGVITDPATSTFAQELSRQIDTSFDQIAFGHLERATLSINPMQEEVSTADAITAHYETWKHDWEVGLIGIRQIGADLAVGLPAAGAANPLTEFMMQSIGSANPEIRIRPVKLIILTYDRVWTFYGTMAPYRWDYSGPRSSDSLTLRPIDIGTPNPTYVQAT